MKKIEPTIAEQNGIIYQIRQKYGIVSDTDSYKMTHHCQYRLGADMMVSYIESRGGMFDACVFFGLQFIIKEYMLQRLTHSQVDNIVAFEREHFMGNYTEDLEIALRAIVNEYDGRFPIRIRAAEEGLVIPVKNVLATIETTVPDPRIFSIVSYFETKLLRVWSPTTVATMSYEIRKIIYEGLEKSSMDPDGQIPFKLHDFGSRGGSSMETIAFAGGGHLVSFMGSDTTMAILATNLAYHCSMSAFSIPASEHSTTTMEGRDGEEAFISRMFDNFAKPGAIFATVIDSFAALNFIDKLAPKFKDRLIESGATWVLRPDSSDAIEMPIETIRRLSKHFGYTTNEKGFKVLNNVRVIQGDGINIYDVQSIVNKLIEEKWSIDNIAFGMGGGLLQKNDRDTQKFAMKCCAARINGEWIDVYKDPEIYNPETWELLDTKKGENGFKTSKRGRLELMYNTQTKDYKTMCLDSAEGYDGKYGWRKMLDTVYEDGYLVKDLTLDQIRKNAGTFA